MRERVKLSVEELLEVKWLMGSVLALLSIWSLFSLDIGGQWFLYAALGAVLFALMRPDLVGGIPKPWLRWAGPAIFVLIAVDFIVNIPKLPEFMPSLVRMVVLLLLYRVFAPRRKRDDLQLILLCLFCLVISGVLTVSLLFAFQILLFTPAAMALLFVICLLDRGADLERSIPSWRRFSWPRLLRRVWAVIDLKVVSLGTAMFLFVVAVSSLLFVLTPRINIDQALPFLQISGEARSGFNDRVELGEITEIKEDNGVALRVDVPSLDALGAMPYWRMMVLDSYSDGAFRLSPYLDKSKERSRKNVRELSGWGGPGNGRRSGQWTFYLEGGVSEYLPLPGTYETLRFQSEQGIERLMALRIVNTEKVLQKVFSYRVDGLEPTNRYPAAPVEKRSFREPFDGAGDRMIYPDTARALELEASERAELARINAELNPEGLPLDAASFSERTTEYLRRNFIYSLRPDGLDGEGDPVVSWLVEGSRGHCELFAGAFVLLAREAGYPARMAVGFAGGSWNPVEEYFVVRNRDAHAWVEIYSAETREWLRIDPTPGNGPSNPDLEVAGRVDFDSGWAAWVDSLRILWYRRIVNFDEEDQTTMADTASELWKDGYRAAVATLREGLAELKAWIRAPFAERGFGWFPSIVFSVATVYFVWRLRYWLARGMAAIVRRPGQMDPLRKEAGRYLRWVRERRTAIPPEGELHERLRGLTAQLEALRFGPRSSIQEARTVFNRAKRLLRRRA